MVPVASVNLRNLGKKPNKTMKSRYLRHFPKNDMRKKRLEPLRPFGHQLLKPGVRLPIPPLPRRNRIITSRRNSQTPGRLKRAAFAGISAVSFTLAARESFLLVSAAHGRPVVTHVGRNSMPHCTKCGICCPQTTPHFVPIPGAPRRGDLWPRRSVAAPRRHLVHQGCPKNVAGRFATRSKLGHGALDFHFIDKRPFSHFRRRNPL